MSELSGKFLIVRLETLDIDALSKIDSDKVIDIKELSMMNTAAAQAMVRGDSISLNRKLYIATKDFVDLYLSKIGRG
ncbi:MAG: hypothetical protein IMF01_09450 [Proteobacteria bacterium]|nr:hypothetical protein [Pseudomonadota bacterium]